MELGIHDPLTMLVFGGLFFIFIALAKIGRIEVIKGKGKYFFVIGIVACIAGVYFFLQGSAVTPIETSISTEAQPEGSTLTETLEETPIETETQAETDTEEDVSTGVDKTIETETESTEPVTSFEVDNLPHVVWSYSVYNNSHLTKLYEGEKIVDVTVRVKSSNDVSIGTFPKWWKFASDEEEYSCDDYVSLSIGNPAYKIAPYNRCTFHLVYIIDGEPKDAKLIYRPFTNT